MVGQRPRTVQENVLVVEQLANGSRAMAVNPGNLEDRNSLAKQLLAIRMFVKNTDVVNGNGSGLLHSFLQSASPKNSEFQALHC